MGVVSLPRCGQLPSTASLASMPVLLAGTLPVMASSSEVDLSTTQSPPSHLGSMGGGAGLTPMTPLASLLPPTAPSPSYEAVDVGTHTPSVPKKLPEKIWSSKFLEISELLPSRLGAPEQCPAGTG